MAKVTIGEIMNSMSQEIGMLKSSINKAWLYNQLSYVIGIHSVDFQGRAVVIFTTAFESHLSHFRSRNVGQTS